MKAPQRWAAAAVLWGVQPDDISQTLSRENKFDFRKI
jgi:hypothetical protein